jgi:hypothetical protein
MTKEEFEELKSLTNKIKIGSGRLGLTDVELKEIQEKCQQLSFNERANLFSFSRTAVGSLIYDHGEVFKAVVEIDDSSSEEREHRPHAIIKIRDNYKVLLDFCGKRK